MQNIDLVSVQNEIDSNKALLLYYYSDRCAPCISLRPKVQELISEDFKEIKTLFIDSDKFPEITAHFGIFSNPTILLFFEGKEFKRWSKYVSIAQISEAIERPYSMLFEE